MPIQKELLDILCCPETKEPVTLIDESLVVKINDAIRSGVIRYRNGETVTEIIDSGLLREDKKYLYPIRNDIPIMLIEEAIDMSTIP
ncbi:MAG: Trm112 family protein [FCB group bacterium]|nr:Trm112 family protein [FCB group bacterium]